MLLESQISIQITFQNSCGLPIFSPAIILYVSVSVAAIKSCFKVDIRNANLLTNENQNKLY